MANQTEEPQTVTLDDFGEYLKEQEVTVGEISRLKRAVVFHFRYGLRPTHFKPTVTCRLCGLDWFACGHYSLDSPLFVKQDLIKAVEDHFGMKPTQTMGIGVLADKRIRGWLHIPERQP